MKLAIRNAELDVLKALSYIIDVEEGGKLFHSWRVAVLAKCLAEEKCRELSLQIYIAGLLHDIGTFDLANRLIHHEKHMEDVKVRDVRVHPQKGSAIVASLQDFVPIARTILDHHEWISGEGYPRGLKNNKISLESQILRIADKVAFLIDTKTVEELEGLAKTLRDRIGREFSEDLFECLIGKLEKKHLWSSVRNEKELARFTKEILAAMDTRKDTGSGRGRNLLPFFGRVLDAKHSYTEGHSRRVSYFSLLIALALNLSDEDVERIESAAFLHDIGKVGISKSILDKKGKLNAQEFEVIKKHALLSYNIVKGISVFEKLADMVGADQEHWDGSGYPKGLKMKEIPVGARVICIADAFDAMTSNRSYRKAMSVPDAIDELKRCSGTDFDPDIVGVACKLFEGFENSAILACYIEKRTGRG